MSEAIKNLKRYAKLGIKIEASSYVSDLWIKNLNMRERLLSLPWRPWVKTKTVESPRGYLLTDGRLLVSPKTKHLLENAIFEDDFNLD